MGGVSGDVKLQSLADLITALRPGDPCPWCGARLESGQSLRPVSGEAADEPSERTDPVLVCRRCGSAVFQASRGALSGCRGSLGAAA